MTIKTLALMRRIGGELEFRAHTLAGYWSEAALERFAAARGCEMTRATAYSDREEWKAPIRGSVRVWRHGVQS